MGRNGTECAQFEFKAIIENQNHKGDDTVVNLLLPYTEKKNKQIK